MNAIRSSIVTVLLFAAPGAAFSQQSTAVTAEDSARIRSIEQKWETVRKGLDWSTEAARQVSSRTMLDASKARTAAIQAEARRRNIPLTLKGRSGDEAVLVRLEEDGRPLYEGPDNDNARITTAVHLFQGSGSNGPGGAGFRIGIWDGGAVRDGHDEFNNTGSSRIDLGGDTLFMSNHATHVGGTLAAFGVKTGARGMAPLARLLSYDSSNDVAEAGPVGATGAGDNVADKVCVSNHSYSIWGGWRDIEIPANSGTFVRTWLGKKSELEDSTLGQYGAECKAWDEYCTTHLYHLPFRSAGNNRSNPAPVQGATFRWSDGTTATYNAAIHPPANDSRGGWDLLGSQSTAKNVITVGAVTPAVVAGARSIPAASSASFSSWGPTDDGRIKPDIVADGVSLYSSIATGNSDYDWYSGTSMATPNACGSAVLLQERFRALNGVIMQASTLKALIIHTADDLGNNGPDYSFGWGLMNASAARDLITLDAETTVPVILEGTLEQGGEYTLPIFAGASGTVKATICWTDPAAPVSSSNDDGALKLVNDLNLTLEYVNSNGTTTINRPWVLNPANPSASASTGINNRDNVEQVVWNNASGLRWIHVRHQGTLTGGSQKFSLIISGHNTSDEPPSMHITGPLLGAEGVEGINAGSRSFGVTNTGGGALNWTAVSETPWLSVTPATGSSAGEKDTVTVNVNSAGLAAGNYSGTVRITANGQQDKTVIVLLTQRKNVTLPEALDTPGRTWTPSPAGSWVGWDGESWDNEDAAVLNRSVAGSSHSLTTTVTGPALVRWRWKLEEYGEFSQGVFLVNGAVERYLLQNMGWNTATHVLPAGVWTLEFTRSDIGQGPASSRMMIDKFEVINPPVVQAQTLTGFVGQAVSFQCTGTETPTSWGLSGSIPGLTLNTATGVISGTPSTAGTYSRVLTAQNAAGSGSGALTATIYDSTTLQAALDNADLNFLRNDDVPWFGQSVTTHDGVDAARSGAIGHSAESNMAFNITGPAVVRWWWKVSSEANWDRLRVFLDTAENANIHGEVDWTQRTLTIPSGLHTVNFRYTKDGSNIAGQDAGWVDQIELVFPPEIGPLRGLSPAMPSGVTGVPYAYRVPYTTTGTTTFSAAGLPSPLTISPATGIISGTPGGPGTYTITIQAVNAAGSDSQVLSFEVAAPIPLDQAVETEGILTWTAGGTYNMVGVPGDFYARDAARSGPITHNQQSWMQSNIVGPALLTYIWQCDSEPGYDKLRCLLDGVEQAAISGIVPSETRTLVIPAGSHFVKFSYEKDVSLSVGDDTGWVERVTVQYPPVFTSGAAVSGWAGQDILHTIAVNNADTVTCGSLPPGLVFNSVARTITGSTTSTGTFTPVVTATNAAGSTQQTLSITITPTITIPTAIDYPLIATWTTGASAPWFGQAAVSNDGVDAARAGILAQGEYQTYMSTTITGPSRLTWKWKVKSSVNRDYLIARLNGLEYSSISGDTGWVDGVMILPAGTHTVRFEFLKGVDDFISGEGAWVDQFNRQIPPAVLGGNTNGSVGTPYAGSIAWVQGSPLAFSASGLPPGLSLNTITGAISGTPTHPGVYAVTYSASNAAGSNSANATITIVAPITLPAALDSTLTWTTSGPAWFGQAMTTRDGTDAARCGIVREPLEESSPEESVMQTTVTGPGYFACYARTDSELNYDSLRVSLDGVVKQSLSGQSASWTRIVIPVPDGVHTIRFSYSKDTSVSVGQDTAWVDQVTWSNTGLTGEITNSGRNTSVTFGTAIGANFQLQTSTDLVTWTNVGAVVAGTGLPVISSQQYAVSPRRFWRVVETLAP